MQVILTEEEYLKFKKLEDICPKLEKENEMLQEELNKTKERLSKVENRRQVLHEENCILCRYINEELFHNTKGFNFNGYGEVEIFDTKTFKTLRELQWNEPIPKDSDDFLKDIGVKK